MSDAMSLIESSYGMTEIVGPVDGDKEVGNGASEPVRIEFVRTSYSRLQVRHP